MKKWVVFVSDNSLLFLLLVSFATLISLFFVRKLNVEAFPDPAPPIVEIVTLYEGKSAEEVEKLITVPVEVAIAGMRNLERVNSISLYGLSDTKCKFSYEASYKEAKQEVLNRLANLTLPEGLQPTVIPNPIGEVMRYTVTGSENLMELRTLQDWVISRQLKTANGVEDVVSFGGYIKAYVVEIAPENLIKYDIPLSQVMDSLSKSNLNVGGRAFEMGNQYYMVRGIGRIKSLKDIENTLVAYKNGKPILVKNIARVTIGNIPQTGIGGLNNKDETVTGTVILRKDAKGIPSIRSINEKVREINERVLPKGIKVVPFYERWELITTVVKKVAETALSGIALVAIAFFVFLGNIRAAIITTLVIPISLLITLALMSIRGESANLLSISAIDFGILADIPLLLVEDYFRTSKKVGADLRAIVKVAEDIGKPILFSILIILLAFIPIFTMKGAESQIFSPMARTYFYALILTLVLTFTYLIAAKHLFLKGQKEREFRFVEIMRENYVKLVNFFLKKHRKVLLITSIVVVTGLIVGLRMLGTQFLPKMDEGNLYIRIIYPYSISLNKAYENTKKVRDLLMKFPEVKTVSFRVGRPEDGSDPSGPYNSEYCVPLKPYREWKRRITKEQLENITRDELRKLLPNVDINISQYIQDNLEEAMSGVKGENSIKIFGEDLQELDRMAKNVDETIEKVPGIKDVGVFRELGQPNLLIEVDRENASTLGLTVQDVLDTVSAALGGKTVSEILEGEKRFALLARFPSEYRKEPEKIANIPIILPDGGIVALSRVAKIRYDTGATFIFRENFKRYIPVKFSVTSKNLGGTVAHAQKEVAKLDIPEGYYMVWSGMFNEMKQAFRRFYVIIPLAIFMILTVLFMYYRSVQNVLITMVAPAFAVVGGLISLLITGESLSISSIVGFISTIGVSVLNASIMISHYIRLSSEGKNGEEAIQETIRDKFRPVLMSGVVASLGLLPASLAHGVGSQVQKPLAIVVVGGMLIGTTLQLLIIPLLLRFIYVAPKSISKLVMEKEFEVDI